MNNKSYEITIANDMLWVEADPDDYDVEATENDFEIKFEKALREAGYEDVSILWGNVGSLQVFNDTEETDDPVAQNDIRNIMNEIEVDYYEITIKTINENNVEEKIKKGDVITVKPHSTYQHLVQNAVVTPPIEHKHNGYKNAVVIGLYDDGVGGTSVEVEFPSGRIDNVPLEYCQKHANQ